MVLDILPQMVVNTLIFASPIALLAVGLTLVFGVLDIPDFAQGALVMLGAYVVWFGVNELGVSYFLSVPLAALITAGLGVSYYRVFYQRIQIMGSEEEYTSNFIIALGIFLVLQYSAYYLAGTTGRYVASPLSGGIFNPFGAFMTHHQAFVIGLAGVSIVALFIFLKYTLLGKAIQAVDQDLAGAESVGINVRHVTYIVFIIASFYAGLGGGIVAPMRTVHPVTGFHIAIQAFAAVIVGGLGSVRGAVIAVLLLATIQNFSIIFLTSRFVEAYVFAILFLVLIFRPQGIIPSGRGV